MGPGVGLVLEAVAVVSQVSVRKDPKTGEMEVVDIKSLEGFGVVK